MSPCLFSTNAQNLGNGYGMLQIAAIIAFAMEWKMLVTKQIQVWAMELVALEAILSAYLLALFAAWQ